MGKCWRESPHRRPTFEAIHSTLKEGSMSAQGPAPSGPPPIATATPSQQQRKRRSGSGPAIPLPARHGLVDPMVDARSDRDGHTWHSNTLDATRSSSRLNLTTVFDQHNLRSDDELSTSTRIAADSYRAAPVPHGSAANPPHGGGAAEPERSPMG